MSTTMVEDAARGVRLEVRVAGEGEDVVLVPSAMRSSDDFAHLQHALADAGYRSLAINLRGAGRSTPPKPAVSLRDVAADVALVITALGTGKAHLVGHALGNIVVRATASYHPERAATVTAMPCGGSSPSDYSVSSEVVTALARCHDETLSEQDRLAALGIAFFAPGNDPRVWLDGWFPRSSLGAVVTGTDPQEWWHAGSAPLLILQPLNDAMAPAHVARAAAAALGDRVTYAEIPDCGHAILPEQPERIAAHIIAFLQAHPMQAAH